MRRFALLLVVGCHGRADAAATPPAASGAAASAPSASPNADAGGPVVVTEGQETHFKSGGRGTVAGATFAVRMLPKLIVQGPQPEIEQAEIDVARGADHAVLLVDTRHKRAEWSGLVFELGYADVYHDDIVLTVRRK